MGRFPWVVFWRICLCQSRIRKLPVDLASSSPFRYLW